MKLVRVDINDCERIWHLQILAFADLLTKYEDYETSPGNETIESIKNKLNQEGTYFYYIYNEDSLVGAIRVVDKKDGSNFYSKRISQ